MAKRKASGGTRRKSAAKGAGRSKKTTRKRAARAASRRTTASSGRAAAKRSAATRRKAAKTGGRTSSARRAGAATGRKKKAATRKASTASRGSTARRATTRKAAARKTATARAGRTAGPPRRATTRTVPVSARKRPDLSRPRRVVADEDEIAQTPPSSLDLDRTASASRSGRRELRERFDEHTETGPAVTGGDVDADWESAYAVGDEAPGGDSPTPDQDIVDDIGRAVGVEYQDTEELKGDEKIVRRDRHRWELDPASSEDYEDR